MFVFFIVIIIIIIIHDNKIFTCETAVHNCIASVNPSTAHVKEEGKVGLILRKKAGF